MGLGADLQLYHDGGNSYVSESGTGALVLQSNGTAIVLEKTDGENMILANTDGDVKLYYNGSEKLATTSTGATVTGALKTTTILDTNNSAGTSGQILTSTGSALDWKTLGEISGVDGSGTANYLSKWTDSDTIGNSTISDNGSTVTLASDVHIYKVGSDKKLWLSEGTSGNGLTNVQLSPNGVSYLKGGSVGIGTTAPSQLLHVWKAGVLEPLFQSTTGRVGLQLSAGAVGDVSWILYSGYPAAGDFTIRESGVGNHLLIKKTTGNATFSGNVLVNSGSIILYGDGDALFAGTSANMSWDRSDSALEFQDNAKIKLGTGNDLEIYHDGNHSYISDVGTGALKLKSDDFRVENTSGNNLFKGVGSVASLYFNGSEKLATTSTGVAVTGTVTATTAITTGLTPLLLDSRYRARFINHDTGAGGMQLQVQNTDETGLPIQVRER